MLAGEVPLSGWKTGLAQALKLVGYALPLALMIAYLRNPAILAGVQLDAGVATYLLAGWALLGVDSFFKLGIVADVLRVAKGVKDLS